MGIIKPNYHHGYVTMCVYTSKVWELVNQHHWYVLYTVTTTNLFNYKTTLCVYTSKGIAKALVVGRVQMSEAIPLSSLPWVTGADPQNCNKQVGYNKCNSKELEEKVQSIFTTWTATFLLERGCSLPCQRILKSWWVFHENLDQ